MLSVGGGASLRVGGDWPKEKNETTTARSTATTPTTTIRHRSLGAIRENCSEARGRLQETVAGVLAQGRGDRPRRAMTKSTFCAYHHRAVQSTEQLAQTDTSRGCVTGIEVSRAFFEGIVLDGCAEWQPAAQFGDAFAPLHEIDLGETKLLAPCTVLGRFVGQRCLSQGALNGFECHRPAVKR